MGTKDGYCTGCELVTGTTWIKGYCPHCGVEWSPELARRLGKKVNRVIGMWEALNSGHVIHCSVCHKRTAKGFFEGRNKKPFKRASQIRLIDAEGKQKFVYYGPSKGLRDELSTREVSWPDGFRGTGAALADRLRMPIHELAEQMGMSDEELVTSTFDVGTSKLEQA